MAIESFTIDIPHETGPHRLACRRSGTAKETVLCIHGLTRNSRDFDFLAEALSERYQVLCPDMPGRGESSWLSDPMLYNYQTYLADLQYLLKSQGITAVHWVGTSMGGILGMMAASAMPGMIQSLVLNDIGCVIPKEGLKRILSYAGVKMVFNSRAEAETNLRTSMEPFGVNDEKQWRHIFAHSLKETEDGKIRLNYDPKIITPLAPDKEIEDIDLWAFWPAVLPIPTFIIRGENSDILTYQTMLAMFLSHERSIFQEIKNTGHAPMLMDAAQIELIENWLRKNRALLVS